LLLKVENGKKVEIDFSDVIIASTSFFDEGFGKLTEHGWTKNTFDSLISLKNINDRDLSVLREMCKNRGMKCEKEDGF
jgi:hypothetical protein